MKHKTLLLLTCLNIYGQIGNSQQGGFVGTPSGGFCDTKPGNPANKKCETFAQAGVRIKSGPKDDKWVMPEGLFLEISRIISTIPISDKAKKILLDNTIGSSRTFTVVDEKNRKQADTAKKIYITALKSILSAKDLERIEIFQISTKDETFLFPEFFALNLTGMALSMIHEAGVRGRDVTILPYVMEYDGLIQDWLTRDTSKPASLSKFYRFSELTMILSYFGGFTGETKRKDHYRAYEFSKLLSETRSYFPMNEFCILKDHSNSGSDWISWLCLEERAQVLKFTFYIGIEKDITNQIRPMDFSFVLNRELNKVVKLFAKNLGGGEMDLEKICSLVLEGQRVLVGFQSSDGREVDRGTGLTVEEEACQSDSTGEKYLVVRKIQ